MSISLIAQQFSGNGYAHTPKGNFHVLVIFVGFEDDQVDMGDPQDQYDCYWNHDEIPLWAQGESNYLFDKDANNIGINYDYRFNLSNFYKKMSNGQFIVTGEVFPEMVKLPGSYNPNADITPIYQYISTNYPSYNWGRFDNRTNGCNFTTDNSNSSPDNIIDYVEIILRNNGSSVSPGFTGVAGVGSGTVTTNYGGIQKTYSVNSGHTALNSMNSHSHHSIFFKHELAHNLYIIGHYNNANQTDGYSYYMSKGWGLMAGWHEPWNTTNAWEMWYLDWFTPQTVTTNGIYTLGDLVLSRDAIRIPVPGTTHDWLWIEYHNKLNYNNNTNPFDQKPYYQDAPINSGVFYVCCARLG